MVIEKKIIECRKQEDMRVMKDSGVEKKSGKIRSYKRKKIAFLGH
jgi:hypothetical protein